MRSLGGKVDVGNRMAGTDGATSEILNSDSASTNLRKELLEPGTNRNSGMFHSRAKEADTPWGSSSQTHRIWDASNPSCVQRRPQTQEVLKDWPTQELLPRPLLSKSPRSMLSKSLSAEQMRTESAEPPTEAEATARLYRRAQKGQRLLLALGVESKFDDAVSVLLRQISALYSGVDGSRSQHISFKELKARLSEVMTRSVPVLTRVRQQLQSANEVFQLEEEAAAELRMHRPRKLGSLTKGSDGLDVHAQLRILQNQVRHYQDSLTGGEQERQELLQELATMRSRMTSIAHELYTVQSREREREQLANSGSRDSVAAESRRPRTNSRQQRRHNHVQPLSPWANDGGSGSNDTKLNKFLPALNSEGGSFFPQPKKR
jgi:hypothetical protein